MSIYKAEVEHVSFDLWEEMEDDIKLSLLEISEASFVGALKDRVASLRADITFSIDDAFSVLRETIPSGSSAILQFNEDNVVKTARESFLRDIMKSVYAKFHQAKALVRGRDPAADSSVIAAEAWDEGRRPPLEPVKCGEEEEADLLRRWVALGEGTILKNHPLGGVYIDMRRGYGFGNPNELALERLDSEIVHRAPYLNGLKRDEVKQYYADVHLEMGDCGPEETGRRLLEMVEQNVTPVELGIVQELYFQRVYEAKAGPKM